MIQCCAVAAAAAAAALLIGNNGWWQRTEQLYNGFAISLDSFPIYKRPDIVIMDRQQKGVFCVRSLLQLSLLSSVTLIRKQYALPVYTMLSLRSKYQAQILSLSYNCETQIYAYISKSPFAAYVRFRMSASGRPKHLVDYFVELAHNNVSFDAICTAIDVDVLMNEAYGLFTM